MISRPNSSRPKQKNFQYVLSLYHFFKEWRKNPQWSFSCCLALLLTLNALPREISGLAETNVLESQLDTGEISVPTILAAVKDSGAIDVTLEEGEQGDDVTAETRGSSQGAKYGNKRSHQGTQTDPYLLSIADTLVHEQIEKTRVNSCLGSRNQTRILESAKEEVLEPDKTCPSVM
ncbi:hypothetical protein ACROYT_G020198 [Oculina patagonica]